MFSPYWENRLAELYVGVRFCRATREWEWRVFDGSSTNVPTLTDWWGANTLRDGSRPWRLYQNTPGGALQRGLDEARQIVAEEAGEADADDAADAALEAFNG